MIEVAKLKTIFPELSHSLDFAGDLTSVKHMNLHTVWKGEWGRVPASSSVIFFIFAHEHGVGSFCFFCMTSNRRPKV